MSAPANWYPDPQGRNELRYWDGTAWTDHVSNGGIQATDPVHAAPTSVATAVNPATAATPTRLDRLDSAVTVGNEADAAKIQQQLHGSGVRSAGIAGKVDGGADRSSTSRSSWSTRRRS